MSALAASLRVDRLDILRGELRKLPAFLRRDFLVAWSYRLSFVTDALSLFVQVLVFAFVGKLIDPSVLPAYGGQSDQLRRVCGNQASRSRFPTDRARSGDGCHPQ